MGKSKGAIGLHIVVSLLIVIAGGFELSAKPPAKSNSGGSAAPPWSVQVESVDAGNVQLDPAFQVAIYENLLVELAKTKSFTKVFRSGDTTAVAEANLLILKTTVEKYTLGSETRRAVTTLSGATKLRVHSQLCTREGNALVEWTVNGNVRFIGSNLRATHNLARNVANDIKKWEFPEPGVSVSAENGPNYVGSGDEIIDLAPVNILR